MPGDENNALANDFAGVQIRTWSDKSNALASKLGHFQKDKSNAGVTSPMPQLPSPEANIFFIRNEAGPKTQPQKDKSKAGVTSPPQLPRPEKTQNFLDSASKRQVQC